MKLSSTQRNNTPEQVTSYKDDLYSIFLLEFDARGVAYFNWISMIPEISGTLLKSDAPIALIRRLAANPSILSIMLSPEPSDALERIIHSEDPDIVVRYITDFLEDLTLNCRLRDNELFTKNFDIFHHQLEEVIKSQSTIYDVDRTKIDAAWERYGYQLLTLHYLRKIGINYVCKERHSEA